MENEEKERAKDKIRKLLNLAENNQNEHEYQSAILRAQKMLLQFKIEESELEDGKTPEIEIVSVMANKASNTLWEMKIAKILEKNFGVMLYYHARGSNKTPVFFGESDKANICKDMYEYISPWLNKKASSYATKMRNDRGIVKGIKQDYILGFLNGLEDKFKEQVDASVQYALVVVVNPLVKDAYKEMSRNFTKAKTTPGINTHGLSEARLSGYQEGKSFSTNKLSGGTSKGSERIG